MMAGGRCTGEHTWASPKPCLLLFRWGSHLFVLRQTASHTRGHGAHNGKKKSGTARLTHHMQRKQTTEGRSTPKEQSRTRAKDGSNAGRNLSGLVTLALLALAWNILRAKNLTPTDGESYEDGTCLIKTCPPVPITSSSIFIQCIDSSPFTNTTAELGADNEAFVRLP
ncbi:unnamed protein product [Ectocarpus sp. 12 AP-2014]